MTNLTLSNVIYATPHFIARVFFVFLAQNILLHMWIIQICIIVWQINCRCESQNHWNTFIVEDDFKFISSNGLNAVRIPVGWWIASDPTPPKPYVGGSLQALDDAFKWAQYVYLHPNNNCLSLFFVVMHEKLQLEIRPADWAGLLAKVNRIDT